MPERAYSKRELDMKFKSSEDKNDAWSATIMSALEDMRKHELQPILKQTTLTNGRVGVLEKRQSKTEELIIFLRGGAYFFVPAFMAVSGWLIWNQLTLQGSIQTTIDDKFDEYETYQTNVE